jgi:hypothetical protein
VRYDGERIAHLSGNLSVDLGIGGVVERRQYERLWGEKERGKRGREKTGRETMGFQITMP